MTTINHPTLDGERLLQIARDTGLRHHLHAVSPTDARELLSRYVEAVLNVHTPALLDAVDGAIAFGTSDVNAPPTGHWLQRFWDIGRDQAAVRDQALAALEGVVRVADRATVEFDAVHAAISALKGTHAAAVADARPLIPGTPERIYLIMDHDDREPAHFDELEEVCWCAHSQGPDDIEYVLAAPQGRQLAGNAGQVADAQPLQVHDLKTSTGATEFLLEYFSKRLGRHDFRTYIRERLAKDFACALAQHLAAPAAGQISGNAGEVQRDAERYRFAMDWQTSGFAVCMLIEDAEGWAPILNNGPIDAAIAASKGAS